MRIAVLCLCLAAVSAAQSAGGSLPAPRVSQITSSGFTVSWTTSQPLNTQLHYGAGNTTATLNNWKLATVHTVTLTGLEPGVTYSVQAESSYYTNPDLISPVIPVTTAGTGGTVTPPPPPPPPTTSGSGIAALSVTQLSSSGFTVSWTTSQSLNSQLHYGTSALTQTQSNWKLATQHSITLSGLQSGTAYSIQAESSYYTNPDLTSAVQMVTTLGAGTGTGSGGTPQPPPPPPPPPPVVSGTRLFPSSAADWLYSAPTGTALNISSVTSGMRWDLNVHSQGFDYPVVTTDGTHGCTNFTDTLQYAYTDHYCVPNPPAGYWPSVGGWGANDGHLVVVDTSTGYYYDFWKLYVNSSGQPTSTNVGGLARGALSGNGTPGHTASKITGLAGDIMPGELDCATCLNHALSLIVPSSMNSNLVGTQAPAMKTDGTVRGALFREGAKIRFDPSINVSSLTASTAVKAILRALQLYGGVITDQTGGSQMAFYTDLASKPDMTGMNLIGQHLFLYY